MEGTERDQALLRDIAEHYGLTPAALARRAGVAVTTINRPFSGTSTHRLSQPTLDKLQAAFADFPGWQAYLGRAVSDRQLAFRPAAPERNDDLVEIDQVDLSYGLGGAFVDDNTIESEPRSFSRAWLRSITDSQPSSLFWAAGRGNSMSPTIEDGEIVLGDRSQTQPRDDDLIWVCALGEIGMIKRLRVRADHVKILSDNPLVPDDTAHDDDNLRIIGRVIAVIRRL